MRKEKAENPDLVSTFDLGATEKSLWDPDQTPIEGITAVVCTHLRAASVSAFLDSFAGQTRDIRLLVVVDASPTDGTEKVVRRLGEGKLPAAGVRFVRVKGKLAGLTRQRNYAMKSVTTDLVVFFDDDVIIRPDTVEELERPFRTKGSGVVGSGVYAEGSYQAPDRLWRMRKRLHIIGDLRPGSYQRSGMSVPLAFLPPGEGIVETDYLPGFGMMYRAAVVRKLGFGEIYSGYGQGEDLDFSLRAKKEGKLVIAQRALLHHMADPGGRPAPGKLGFMAIYNRFHIQKRGLPDRTWRDVIWFAYAWGLDTVMLFRSLPIPSRTRSTILQIGGRIWAVVILLMEIDW
jgi:GT2 family glycosyltransferase